MEDLQKTDIFKIYFTPFVWTRLTFLLNWPNILANSVNTKCRPFKLIAIPFCKIIVDAPGQGAHCFVSFFYY